MGSIGPFSFTTMEGRLQTSTSAMVPTLRGLRTNRPRAKPTRIRTVETPSTFLAAWIQALFYRAGIGSIAAVIDDSGIICPYALIADCRCTIEAAAAPGGALLTTVWTIVPPITFGWYGQVSQGKTVDINSLGVRVMTQPTTQAMAGTNPRVGGYTFTTMTGDLQWPITEGQIQEQEAAAKAIGIDNVIKRPSTSAGSIQVAVDCADDPTAFAIMNGIRAQVGTFIDIDVGGLVIPAVPLSDANFTWRPTVVLPNSSTQLLQGVLELNTQNAGGSGGPAATVQVASTWGNWQNVKAAYCGKGNEGLGGVASTIAWVQDLGRVLVSGGIGIAGPNGSAGSANQTNEPTDYTGMWCRILSKRDLLGNPSPDGTVVAPIWWGEVLKDKISGGAGEGAAVRNATCAGLMHALSRCFPLRWYEMGQNNVNQADPGEVLPFNQVRGGDASNVNAGTGEVNNVTVHDRVRMDQNNPPQANPTPWTALMLMQAWIKAFQAQYPQGPRFTLAGQTAPLAFYNGYDLRLKSFADGVCEVVSPRIGFTFRVEVDSSDNVMLRVNSVVPSNLTVPGLGTLLANDRQVTLDLTGTSITSWDLDRDRTVEADHVIIRGGRPWYGMTFGFGLSGTRTYQLVKGWDSTSGANSEENLWQQGNLQTRDAIHLHHVWRRWRLDPAWNGSGFFSPNRNDFFKFTRETATNAQNGVNGYTGNLLASGATTWPKSANLRFTRELPIWSGKDWAAINGSSSPVDAKSLPGNQLEGPILFGKHVDGTLEYLSHRWQVQVEDDNCGIILGHDARDGAAIQAYLNQGNTILVTIGITHPLPWTASWRRAQASRPRDMERCVVLSFPHLTYGLMVQSTLLWLDSTTGAHQCQWDIRLDWETIFGSGIAKLTPLLQLAALRYSNPLISLSWTQRGVIDAGTALAPGSMITAAKLPLDASRTWTPNMQAIISGRHWSFTAGELATSYTAQPLPPSMDRMVLMDAVPMRLLGNALGYALGGAH